MNASPRPPKNPRLAAEGAGRALRDHLGEPRGGNFVEGVEAHVELRKMCPETEGGCDLGPYIPSDDTGNGGAVHLDGEPPRAIRFPAWWRPFFGKQSPRTLRILDMVIEWLDRGGEDEAKKRLSDLDDVIARNRTRKKIKERIWWALKFGGPTALATWGAIIFAKEKVDRFIEQLPVLRAVWKAITGP